MALFFQLLGDVLLEAISVKSVLDSGDHDVQRYISCKTLPHNAPHPGDNIGRVRNEKIADINKINWTPNQHKEYHNLYMKTAKRAATDP